MSSPIYLLPCGFSRTIRRNDLSGVDCICYRLYGSILATDIGTWDYDMAIETAADFYAITLYNRVSPDLYLTISENLTGAYDCSFC